MDRRTFLRVTLGTLAAPLAAEAQSGKVPRVGVLTGQMSSQWSAFREVLREHGYVEGQNVVIEWRPSQGIAERLPDLAAELVRLKVDIIVAVDNPAIIAAHGASKTIPIVIVMATDPVGTGFVASLARPGGNITGLTAQFSELQGKSLQLLKEASPNLSSVGILWDPTEAGPSRRAVAREAEVAAPTLALRAQLFALRTPADLDNVFKAMTRARLDAVLIQGSQMIYAHRARIVRLAAQSRLPTMGWRREIVEAGGLISYGPAYVDLYHRAAGFVDKILRGAKTVDLPVEQPTKFELFINLKTAKALGLTIPQSLLLRADEIIH